MARKKVELEGRVAPGKGDESAKKGEGPDRAPSEVFDGPAHAVNLALGQKVNVNDLKKRELESAFPGRYKFTKIEHHGTLSPVEGDHEFAWEVQNASDDDDQEAAIEAAAVVRDPASDDQHLNPDEEEEGLKG